jgi:hypothetical protein
LETCAEAFAIADRINGRGLETVVVPAARPPQLGVAGEDLDHRLESFELLGAPQSNLFDQYDSRVDLSRLAERHEVPDIRCC